MVELVGNHDGDLAWDNKAAVEVRAATGATLALASDLVVQTEREAAGFALSTATGSTLTTASATFATRSTHRWATMLFVSCCRL